MEPNQNQTPNNNTNPANSQTQTNGQVINNPPITMANQSLPTKGPKSSKLKKVISFLLVIVVIAAVGVLGFLLFKTNGELKKAQKELTQSQDNVKKLDEQLSGYKSVSLFIEKYNNATMSRQLCGGTPVGIFDVHINEKYAVFRYLCSKLTSAAPIRIAALQKNSDGSYQFTYGSSDALPNGLPGYIYNSEPEFFGGEYGAIKF